MKMQIFFILLFTLITFSLSDISPALLTIDLKFKNHTFIIKKKEEEFKYYFNPNTSAILLPEEYYNTFKDILINNNYKCEESEVYYIKYFYYHFFCSGAHSDFSSMKLNFNFDNYTLTYTGNELFQKVKDGYYCYFLTKKGLRYFNIGTLSLAKKNITK